MDIPIFENELGISLISKEIYYAEAEKNFVAFLHEKIDHHEIKRLNEDLFKSLNSDDKNYVLENPLDLDSVIYKLIRNEYGDYYAMDPYQKIKYTFQRPYTYYREMLTVKCTLPEYNLSEYRLRLREIRQMYDEKIITYKEMETLTRKAKEGLSVYDSSKLIKWDDTPKSIFINPPRF